MLIYNVGENVFSLMFSCSASMHLLQRLHELKKREHAAKLYNKQLLQQFEEAQGTLRGMITSTAAMKTIRVNRHTEKNNNIYTSRGRSDKSSRGGMVKCGFFFVAHSISMK